MKDGDGIFPSWTIRQPERGVVTLDSGDGTAVDLVATRPRRRDFLRVLTGCWRPDVHVVPRGIGQMRV